MAKNNTARRTIVYYSNEFFVAGWGRIFGRPMFRRLNNLMFNLATRGLGVGSCDPLSNGEMRLLSRWLSRSRTCPVIWDVGANEGDYTAMIRSVRPDARIWAFEPNPPTFGRMAMRWSDSGVRCIQTALGSSVGALELWDYEDAIGGSSHATFHPAAIGRLTGAKFKSKAVPVRTIDEVAGAENVRAIDLLKMDVEGHELACLEGASKMISEGCIAAVQFEFNAMHLDTRINMWDFADRLPGFTLYRILPHGLHELDLRNPLSSNLYNIQNIFARIKNNFVEIDQR